MISLLTMAQQVMVRVRVRVRGLGLVPARGRGHVTSEAVDHGGPIGDAAATGEVDLVMALVRVSG